MRLIWATLIQASAEAMDFARSLARRRHLPGHARVRSTTHRRGRTPRPMAASERRTVPIVHWPVLSSARRGFGPEYPPSAKTCRSHGQDLRDRGGHAVAVVDVGGVDDGAEQQADGVDDDVTLASVDPLAGIVAPNTAAFGGFHALAVNHAGARPRLAPLRLAGLHRQREAGRPQQPAVAPVVEGVLHRGAGREVLLQHRPLAARRRDVRGRVHHLPKVDGARTSGPVRRRHEGHDQRPFAVVRIACAARHVPLRPLNSFRVGH